MTNDMAEDTALDPRIARSRAKILDAATELLVEGGSRSVTVDAVADRSGVAKSTMYRHFSSRAELLVEVLKHNIPDLDPPESAEDFETSLRTVVANMAKALSQPGQERIVPALLALKNTDPDVAALADQDRDHRMYLVENILNQGVAEGVLPNGIDTEVACSMLVGPLMFAVLLGDQDQLPDIAETVVTRFIESYR